MMLLALTSILAYSLAARGFQLQSRAAITEAVCSSSFSWANNTKKESPCQVAAEVNAPCNHNVWDIPAANASTIYDVPKDGLASQCTCSWASYNLISACQACQGFPEHISSWTPYIINCAGNTSNTYFPSNLALINVSIPYWATTDPTTWTNQLFSPTQAQNIASQGHADVTPTASTTASATPSASASKSTPVGAIVGGVVGGLIVLIAAIFIAIYLIRRASPPQLMSNGAPSTMTMSTHRHFGSHSDITAITNNMSTGIGYTSLSSTPLNPPTSPTIRTHASSSIRSFPFFSSAGSTVPSPPSVRHQSPPPVSVNRDTTAVEPFVLPPSNDHNPDRKQANGAYPTYDAPTALPAMHVEMRPTTPTQGGRAKYNPPAYTPSVAGEGSSSRNRPPPTSGRVHAKKGSADTQHSMTSAVSAGTQRVGGGNSIAAMGNVVMAAGTGPVTTAISTHPSPRAAAIANGNGSRSAVNVIPGHGRELSGNTTNTSRSTSRDEKRRPTNSEGDFSARDIA